MNWNEPNMLKAQTISIGWIFDLLLYATSIQILKNIDSSKIMHSNVIKN